MKLQDLINTAAIHTRFKVFAAVGKEIVLLADCRVDEINKTLDASTREREIAFTSIIKDNKGVALNVLLAC